MKKVLIKLLSIGLVAVLFVTSLGAYKLQTNLAKISKFKSTTIDNKLFISTFIDSEEKENTIVFKVIEEGIVEVDQYINGVYINTAKTSKANGGEIHVYFKEDPYSIMTEDYAVINSDVKSVNAVIPISDIVTINNVDVSNSHGIQETSTNYRNVGDIKFNQSYLYGNPTIYDLTLSIYTRDLGTVNKNHTFNLYEGMALNALISAVGAVLSAIFIPLTGGASSLVYAALAAAGISVIGGIAQGALTQKYYSQITEMNVKANDITLGGSASALSSKTYSATRYRTLLDDDVWSSDYKYDGYMPWDTNQISAWMHNDFLPGLPYYGVERYLRK